MYVNHYHNILCQVSSVCYYYISITKHIPSEHHHCQLQYFFPSLQKRDTLPPQFYSRRINNGVRLF